jgi:peptide/nickel transport system substrate-binding protein
MKPLVALLRRALLALSLAAAATVVAAPAQPGLALRVASAFDPQTMDPHALALLYHSRVAFQIYESLVGRDERFRLEPALALSWQMRSRPRSGASSCARG